MTRLYEDAEIRQAILGTAPERQAIFAWLYKESGWRDWVLHHVQMHSGEQASGEDVFQECIILFDRNLREGRFRAESGLKTYFLGIAKQYWFNRQRSRKNHVVLENISAFTDSGINLENQILDAERADAVNQIIEQIGEHCRKILSLYKLSLSNEEIAKELGLSGPELAKKYTYRCREKFKNFVLSSKFLCEILGVKL